MTKSLVGRLVPDQLWALVELCCPPASLASGARIARRGVESSQRLGRVRWKAERRPTDVFVVLQEPPMDNWGIRGGRMASEVDLGFEVQV
jgi:hypothetical protein